MSRLFVAIMIIATLSGSAFAETCPDCGGDLTDQGRCPYCQPKPEVEQK